jgi:hypothetical protein
VPNNGNGLKLKSYSAAAYAAVAIATPDEDRAISQVLADFPDRQIWTIAAVGGLRDARTRAVVDERAQYPQALARVAGADDAVLIVLDYQHLIRNAAAYRQLRLSFPACKARGSLVVLVAPSWPMPAELQHDIPVLEMALPARAELASALAVCAKSAEMQVSDADAAPILDAAAGLTMGEAENSFALSYAEKGSFDPGRVLQEKLKLVRASGTLEIALPASVSDLGGLGGLREYFQHEVIPSMRDDFLRVRGLLLVGVPGTGKSLSARVAGSLLGWPVLRCDVASLKGSLVGQSEGNMRAALKLAEAVSPCVLYLDELEKAVAGHASSGATDSGVSAGMLQLLLSWLQEHQSAVLTIGTCNDYSKLPSELTRAGRFDERFFVDLPSAQERVEIAAIHLAKFGCDPGLAAHVAELSAEWTGAEIEQLVRSAARRCNRAPKAADLTGISKEIKPISRVRGDEISRLREWGKAQLRIANTPELGPVRSGRRLSQVAGVE